MADNVYQLFKAGQIGNQSRGPRLLPTWLFSTFRHWIGHDSRKHPVALSLNEFLECFSRYRDPARSPPNAVRTISAGLSMPGLSKLQLQIASLNQLSQMITQAQFFCIGQIQELVWRQQQTAFQYTALDNGTNVFDQYRPIYPENNTLNDSS